METTDADVVVIGMGPGGEHVAGRLAAAGLDVVGVEERLVGGECPYWGCVPTKMMIRAADLLAEGRRIPGMAGASTVRADWAKVARRIRDEATDNWDDTKAVDRFVGAGGRFVRGRGRIVGPGEVTVATTPEGNPGSAGEGGGELIVRARRGIVVATGTRPAVPPIEGLAGTPYWTNRTAVETERSPASLVVLGGGAIGSELAQVFSRFGSRVTVVETADRLLSAEEPESGRMLAEVFAGEGIAVLVGGSATAVHHDEHGFTLTIEDGEQVAAERLLVATGRAVDLGETGVGALGIDERARRLPVDDRMRVAPGVWAVGDITGKGEYTHVSMYQAEIVVGEILGHEVPTADYRALPRVTFTDPEIGAVGLTEARAIECGLTVRTGVTRVSTTARGWIHKAGDDGFIKLVADVDRGVLVGATAAGPVGGEVLGALTVAVHGEVPVERLRHMIYAYPTFHRGIEDALRGLSD